jgi:hypothetical protein
MAEIRTFETESNEEPPRLGDITGSRKRKIQGGQNGKEPTL